ncbi:cobalamin receptor [Pasteurellaceae bacterium 15-036681]|nr:cobalamin receptor [Pasteurellaceae bacterium 15-036681]
MKKNLITTSIVLSLSTLAFAEQQAQQPTELKPINVYSAYAAPVNQDKTASSITVLTEKDFADRNATYVSDVLKTVPGVAMAANGGRGSTTSLFMRGAESNHAVVVIDGVKMNPVNGFGFDFGGLSLANVERIEVLRGEQSALWGSDAMGGVVYITTKSGLYKDKPFNIDFDLGTGSKGTYDATATISGYNEGFYYALQGDSHRTRGISAMSKDKFYYTGKNGTKNVPTSSTENDKFHRDNVSARIGYDDNNKGIELLANRSSQTVRFDSTYKRDETYFDDRTRIHENTVKLSGYLGNAQELFKHQFNLSRTKTNSHTFTTDALTSDYVNYTVVPSTTENKAEKLNSKYQLDINFDREGYVTQAVSVLGEHQTAKYSGTEYSDTKKLKEKSAAMEYRLFTEDDHSLALSGRYIDNSQYGDAFTGRISAGYRFSPNFRLHGNFGTATQTPTVSEYFGYAPWTAPNHDLKAEKSRGGDLGLLIESADKEHSLDVTYFARNVKDLIVSPDYTKYVNVEGTSKIKGVEIAYNGKLTDNLSSFANYTYTSAKDSKKEQLILRPKHTANVGLGYQITEQLGSNVSLSYVGKRFDGSSRYNMPSYTLVNLGANYQVNKNINVYANLNNLFNKKYEHTLGYGQFGRNVYVGLKGSF